MEKNTFDWNLVINAFTAIGTVGAVAYAVLRDYVKEYFLKPNLFIDFHKQHGCLESFQESIYVRLIVHNIGKSNANRTQIIVAQAACFDDVENNRQLSSGLRLTWTHLQRPYNSEAIVFKDTYRFIDLGCFFRGDDGETYFQLTTDITPINLNNRLKLDQRILRSYVLTLVGENFETQKYLLTIQINNQTGAGSNINLTDLRSLLDDYTFHLELKKLDKKKRPSKNKG